MTIKKLTHALSILILALLCCYPFNSQRMMLLVDAQASVEVKIGVVVDKESMEGKIELSSIKMAISDFYADHPGCRTRIVPHVRDSKNHDVVEAAAAVLDLIKNEQVPAIMGPESSEEAQFVVNLGEKAQVPIVSYSATSSLLSPLQYPYFVRATENDSSQIQPIVALIQAFEWREVVPIYVDNEFGRGIIPFLADSLQDIGTRIPYRSVIPLATTDDRLKAELYRLKSMSTRVFLVHMEASLGSRLFTKAKDLGMMSKEYVWIITNAMADVLESLNRVVVKSMQGVIGVKTYVARTQRVEHFAVRLNKKIGKQENDALLNNVGASIEGLRAYDATISLARAVEEIGVTNFTFESAKNAANSSSIDISKIGVSKFGKRLLQAIKRSRFRGLGGDYALVDGQLSSSPFELINVRGNKEQEIGFWTESSGLVDRLALANKSNHNIAKAGLKSIMWPGGLTIAPKGWVVSPNGKKLKIGVPVKNGFFQFVKVTQDHVTGKIEVTGYCIDVFDAVMRKLPYYVDYEYIPFMEQYDTLVSQVYLKKFDAVVGDVTIRAHRAANVDFTLPYTESGVVMVVPMKSNENTRAWLFIKPLTWDLWVVAFCSFIFIAFVVWVLEHRINEDFRGPPWHQAGTSLYYSFSTLVFSHSFNVFNNLTRFVVIIWVFVVLILIQSYTANLASLLTVEQLQPAVNSVKELINKGEVVGYQEGSFVERLLKDMGIKPSKLKSYNTTDQLHEFLSNGTQKGGIAAAFDERPYVKGFLAEYGSKYTTVPPTYKTDGFAFVFPKGSPLGSDVSRKVLNVTEGKEMTDIENKWFKDTNCQELSASVSSTSLGLDSFWGLFTIAGVVALCALIISLAKFIREHRSVWSDGNASIWTRIKTLMMIYDQRNLSSHTFKKSQTQDQTYMGTSSNTPYPQSPSNCWNNSDRVVFDDSAQSTPSFEQMDDNVSKPEKLEVSAFEEHA